LRRRCGLVRIGLAQSELGVFLEIALEPVATIERLWQELHRFVDALIGLSATETKEAFSGFPKALATQAGNAEMLVGAFEQEVGQSVRGDP
jgi:hypothetical protein